MAKTTADFPNDLSLKSSVWSQKNGRYVLGGTTEVSAQGLGWWEKREVLPDPSDIVYALEEKYVGRPDLLAYSFYGDSQLWWVIPQYNSILDPDEELILGKLLLIPSFEKINTTYRADNKAGGVTV